MKNFIQQFILSLTILTTSLSLCAQNGGVDFKDGIYLSVGAFKNNSPDIAFKQLCNKEGKALVDFVVKTKNYYRSKDSIVELPSRNIFGYAQKGIFYLKTSFQGTDYYPRLVVIGSICHYVCQVTTTYYDAYYNRPVQNNTSLQQFMLDTETGNISLFNAENFEAILSRDQLLFEEYSALPKKKKRNSQFLYLRKYNERHLLVPGK